MGESIKTASIKAKVLAAITGANRALSHQEITIDLFHQPATQNSSGVPTPEQAEAVLAALVDLEHKGEIQREGDLDKEPVYVLTGKPTRDPKRRQASSEDEPETVAGEAVVVAVADDRVDENEQKA